MRINDITARARQNVGAECGMRNAELNSPICNPQSASGRVNLTPEQGKATEILGKDLCVSAGAGSGKTGILVGRFVNLVVKRGFTVSEILCITFTDKAAGEMKQRIAQRFQSPGLEEQRREVEFAYISTIDSFCSRLLRENALEAGLDPDFLILKEYEARFLQRSLADELLAQWEKTNPAEYNLLLGELYCSDLAESSVELLAKIRSSGLHPGVIPVKNDISPELGETLKNINLYMEKTEDLLSNLPPASRQRAEGILAGLRPLENIRLGELSHKHIANLPEINLGVATALKEVLKVLKGLLERLRHLYWEGEAARTKLALREFLSQLFQLYQEEKRKRAALDFSDLIEKTITLLQAFPLIRKELRGKFRHILVDEFQDTNNLQKTLLEMLKGKDNLLVVGDAQQSIYGFRDADLEVFFEQRRQTQERGGEIIHLNRNFRSRPEIISFVNQVFKGYWGRDGSTVDWKPLVAASSFARKEVPCVEILLACGEKMEESRKLEAHLLAARIKEIVEDGELKLTRPDCQRPVTYGDFAILFRSTTDIKLFEGALEEAGIPFFVTGGKGLYDAREVVDLVNLLRLVDNPLDEVRLAAVLRSPFVGINDQTLFWLAHYAKHKEKVGAYCNTPLLAQLDELASISEIDNTQKERLQRFRGLMERFRGLKERLSIASLIEDILAETHYDSRVLTFPDGSQCYANLRKFIELTRDFEGRGVLGLPQFLRAIRELQVTETRESEAPTDVERGDVVKILTIHKAKGLEFPVVVLADLGRGRKNHPPDILFSRRGGLGLRVINPLTKTEEATAAFREILQEMRQREEAEEERVLYVALTRAQEHLILSGSYSEKTKSEPLKRLAETLNISLDAAGQQGETTFGEEKYRLRVTVERGLSRIIRSHMGLSSKDKEKILQGEELEVSRGGEAPLPDAIPAPRPPGQGDYIYSVTEIMSYHRCPRLYYLRYKLGLPSIESGEALQPHNVEDELESSPWKGLGIAAHRALELYRPPRTPQADNSSGLEEAVLQALEESLPSPVPQEQVDVLKRWVQNFYTSREGEMVVASRDVRHEMPFLFNCSGTPMRGKIDLLYSPQGMNWRLLDFKSSSRDPEMLESYTIQMQLYSLAVKAIFGALPEEVVLFFLPEGKAVTVDIGPVAMKRLEEWLRGFFAAEETILDAAAFPACRRRSCRWCRFDKYCSRG
jgi:ATP-dependent helicase/nuclease subunit A